MELQLGTGSTRLLEMLKNEAPNMKLGKAYNYVKEDQEMRNDLAKYEYIIMMLLKALGVNDSGWLNDKEIGTKLIDMPDEIWYALKLATSVHSGFACSPFTPENWAEQTRKKIGIKKEEMEIYKNGQLSVLFPNED